MGMIKTRVFLIFTLIFIAVTCEEKKERIPVLAFYYVWYATPEVSGFLRHWEGGITHKPYPELYDSSDPEVIKRHVYLAKEAGIDGFIISWWGKDSFEDKVTKLIFDVVEEIKSDVKLSIYYEFIPNFSELQAQNELNYILEKYGKRKSYFRWNRKPVVFVYGRATFPVFSCLVEPCPNFKEVSWKKIIDEIKRKHEVIFIGDVISYSYSEILAQFLLEEGFDGIHVYNPHLDLYFLKVDVDEIKDRYRSMVRFCKERGLISALTVIPGYDDTKLKRKITSVTPREGGKLYRELFTSAKEATPDIILITSFNEWHEGTEIEPSYEWGNFFIELTKNLR